MPGYYYRCCSANGHCGPKNNIQSQDLYCGADTCQVGFGDCSTNRTAPPLSSHAPKTVGMGQTCGPIVNAKCGDGLCCSGSNFCGKSITLTLSVNGREKKKKANPRVAVPLSMHPRHLRLTKPPRNRQHRRLLRSGELVPAALGPLQWSLTIAHQHALSQSPTQPPQYVQRNPSINQKAHHPSSHVLVILVPMYIAF